MKRNAEEIIKFYEKVCKKEARAAKTPAFQNTVLSKNDSDEPIMLEEYRSLVGKLMYYAVKVGPDCANAVRDLARHMKNPGVEHWKAMERIVGYLKGKSLHGLFMHRPSSM